MSTLSIESELTDIMDFLKFVSVSIFISFIGLFIYRYENLNRFKIIPYNSNLFIIDRKTKRVTRLGEKGLKVILKGNEPFLQENYVEAPNYQEVLPIPAEPLPEPLPEILPPEMPQAKTSERSSFVPKQMYEPSQAEVPERSSSASEPIYEQPQTLPQEPSPQEPLPERRERSTSSFSRKLEEQALGKAKDMLYKEATSELGKKYKEEKEAYEERHKEKHEEEREGENDNQ